MPEKKKAKAPSGHSRAAQNKKIRRDALREELQAREYLRQLSTIERRLDPGAKDTYKSEDIAKVKERIGILFRLLDKCLPNLRPVDSPVRLQGVGDTITEQGAAILKAMAAGDITPGEATSLMQAISAQIRVVEADELEKRIKALEEATHGAA
jgi:hypothetical protein